MAVNLSYDGRIVVVHVVTPSSGDDDRRFLQALEGLRSIDDLDYRAAALQGLIAAKLQLELCGSGELIQDTRSNREMIEARSLALHDQARSIGVVP